MYVSGMVRKKLGNFYVACLLARFARCKLYFEYLPLYKRIVSSTFGLVMLACRQTSMPQLDDNPTALQYGRAGFKLKRFVRRHCMHALLKIRLVPHFLLVFDIV